MTRITSLLLVTLLSLAASPVAGAQAGEWRAYSADAAGTKYTPLDQITADNAGDLRVVWRQSTIPDAIRQGSTVRAPAVVQNTPLMADGRLYVSTALGTVAALDATTGEVVWFDPLPDGATRRGSSSRGVAYWRGRDGEDARVIAVVGSTLVALNARTGARYPDFGVDGEVDLTQGYDIRTVTEFGWRSAPLVVNDVVIVGSAIPDIINEEMLARKEMPPGDVRGFDVRTGEQLWIFHTVPQEGEVGNETWLTRTDEDRASWEYTGNTNMWAWPSADEELGYVYLPLSTPTNDYYGGHRPGNNLFAESLVCLDARTGERIWHFQAVHHGVWDYDFPAAPNLVDITVDGRDIKAIAIVSKQGFTYVFDRVTGEPVWPIEERSVPEGNVPGEWYSPTQPFPTKPPPFEQQGVTVDDLIDFTPALRREAEEILAGYVSGPLFTPPKAHRGCRCSSRPMAASWPLTSTRARSSGALRTGTVRGTIRRFATWICRRWGRRRGCLRWSQARSCFSVKASTGGWCCCRRTWAASCSRPTTRRPVPWLPRSSCPAACPGHRSPIWPTVASTSSCRSPGVA